jgi:alkylation response protein AidB-like acyl-CoA dehydrogenase
MGANHLNEVFFDDVVLEPQEILGELDMGWTVVELVLKHERVGIARYARSDKLLGELWKIVQLADGPGAEEQRAAVAHALVKARIARLLSYRTLVSSQKDGSPPQPSVARIVSTLLDQEVSEIAMDSVGAAALDPDPESWHGGWVEDAWRYAQSATIASGTTEIQRLLASRALVNGA